MDSSYFSAVNSFLNKLGLPNVEVTGDGNFAVADEVVGKHNSPDTAIKYEGNGDFGIGMKCKASAEIPTGIAFVFLTTSADLSGTITGKGSIAYDPSKASTWTASGSIGGSIEIGVDAGVKLDAKVVSAEGTIGVKGKVSLDGNIQNSGNAATYVGNCKTDPLTLEGTVKVEFLGDDDFSSQVIDYELIDSSTVPVNFVIYSAS